MPPDPPSGPPPLHRHLLHAATERHVLLLTAAGAFLAYTRLLSTTISFTPPPNAASPAYTHLPSATICHATTLEASSPLRQTVPLATLPLGPSFSSHDSAAFPPSGSTASDVAPSFSARSRRHRLPPPLVLTAPPANLTPPVHPFPLPLSPEPAPPFTPHLLSHDHHRYQSSWCPSPPSSSPPFHGSTTTALHCRCPLPISACTPPPRRRPRCTDSQPDYHQMPGYHHRWQPPATPSVANAITAGSQGPHRQQPPSSPPPPSIYLLSLSLSL